MVTVVYLARHGRTVLNAEGRLRGLSDQPLDDLGRAEATRLGDALARYRPTVVVCGLLQRAVSTAQAIAAAAGVSVVVDDRLNDRDYGGLDRHPSAHGVLQPAEPRRGAVKGGLLRPQARRELMQRQARIDRTSATEQNRAYGRQSPRRSAGAT